MRTTEIERFQSKFTKGDGCWELRRVYAYQDRSHIGHHKAKLTAAQVLAIRRAFAVGLKQMAIGDMYGVSDVTVGRICTREAWAWLPQERVVNAYI